MADDISRELCNAYKGLVESGAAKATSRADLHKAIPRDEAKTKQDLEAQRAYIETIMNKDYDALVVESKEAVSGDNIEKKINEFVMDSYLKGIG